ncbi:MAG: RidA family protein [Chloroflexi bacterium]|nr:RidA family protein [Chloroflexota bacterium]
MKIERLDPGSYLSAAVIAGDIVYVAGITADDLTLDVKGQTKQVLDKIDALLARAGTDKRKLLTANIWLKHIDQWAEMNEIWSAWVVPGQVPARATVEANMARPGLLVEIMVQAAR